jgi:hypothetical protein
MQTLLSTRLFSGRPLDDQVFRLLRDRGFVRLELRTTPDHLDFSSEAEVRMLRRRLESQGIQAPWIYLDEAFLGRLGRDFGLAELTASVMAAGPEAVVIPLPPGRREPWAPTLAEIASYVRRAGARPVVDVRRVDDRALEESPQLGICWDLAFRTDEDEAKWEMVEEGLDRLERWRLSGVRIARARDDRRDPPGEAQAVLLEDLWPRLAPSTLVYDVDSPGTAIVELRRALEEIRAFHMGERRPPERRKGGLFWAALAPG